jgi:hypothetical protein
VKLRPWIVALLTFLASCGSSSATTNAPGVTHRSCGPANAKTLASSAVARVYSLNQVVYGCSVQRGRSLRLGHASRSITESRVGPVAVAGDVAAYGLSRFGVDTVSSAVEVRRLTDGAVLHDLSAASSVGPEFFQSVGSVVVKTDGAVAWVGSASSIISRGRAVVQVRAADSSGERTLDSGRGIDSGSLRLRGSTLSWRDAGVTRHATLR